VRTRPTATLGAYYDIEKNQRLGITGSNPAELVKALELVKSAVEAGELDSQIELASCAVRRGFGR